MKQDIKGTFYVCRQPYGNTKRHIVGKYASLNEARAAASEEDTRDNEIQICSGDWKYTEHICDSRRYKVTAIYEPIHRVYAEITIDNDGEGLLNREARKVMSKMRMMSGVFAVKMQEV